MLADIQTALENPFRDPVRVAGHLMPRRLARQLEWQLLRLRVAERRTLNTPAHSDHGQPHSPGCPQPVRGWPISGRSAAEPLTSTGATHG